MTATIKQSNNSHLATVAIWCTSCAMTDACILICSGQQ